MKSYFKRCSLLCAPFFLAILFLIITTGNAQVTIKEKISIAPKFKTGSDRSTSQLAASISGFIMQRNGSLLIQYDDAWSAISLISPNRLLKIDIHHQPDTLINDVALYRFDSVSPSTLSDCHSQPYNFYYYSNSSFTYYLGPRVQKGDTVQLFYYTDHNPTSGDTTLAISSADTVRVGGQIVRWDAHFATTSSCIVLYEGLDVSVATVDTTITFTALDSNNVYPTYPDSNNTTTKKNYMSLRLNAQFNGAPLINYWVRVDTPVVVDTGGHSPSYHSPIRPLGKYIIPRTGTNQFDTVASFTKQTDSTGSLKFTYIASQFGGVERIRGKAVGDTIYFDTLRIWTVVKGLNPLANNSAYFDLVGGTCQHHGPGASGCPTPDNNHYTIQLVRDSLPLMSELWVDSLKKEMLHVNDISLPYGGLFDVAGLWAPEHSQHREGKSVDLRTAISGLRSGIKVRNTQGKWVGNPAFETLSKRYSVKKPQGHKKGTNGEHYHLNY